MIKANFNAYSSYVTDSLYQWDLNQTLRVTGLNLAVAPEVHFSNANMDRAIVRQAEVVDHVVNVGIPNSLLQDPLTIRAHIGIYEGATFKVVEKIEIPVIARKRPLNYQIETSDEEIYSFKALEAALANKADNAVINARVDNIITHNNDTESNSELVDIRVGADGKTYASAGTAVREQIGRITAITRLNNIELTENKYVNSIGNLTDGDGYYATERYIPIPERGVVKLNNIAAETDTDLEVLTLAFYDASERVIETYPYADVISGSDVIAEIPRGACYMRFGMKGRYTSTYAVGLENLIDILNRYGDEFRDIFSLDYDIISDGYIVHATGKVASYSGYRYSDYIAIPPNTDIVVTNVVYTTSDARGLAFYDANKMFIAGVQYPSGEKLGDITVTSPENALYMRFTLPVANSRYSAVYYSKISGVIEALGNKIAENTARISTIENDNTGSILSEELSENPIERIKSIPDFINIFHNVGCIGDSLSSGYVCSKDNGVTDGVNIYSHSWGQYLARMTGNKYYNWSVGGLTVGSWLVSSYAEECFDGEHLCEAYIIGLGQNDYNVGTPIGTPEDIDRNNYNNNANTFYGDYCRIIQKIHEVQPKAKIFILTDPRSTTESSGYNAAIRTIATLFDNVYLLDLYTYGRNYYDKGIIRESLRGGHYNALSYRIMASIIGTYIDWIIKNNLTDFSQVEFIGTDYEWIE